MLFTSTAGADPALRLSLSQNGDVLVIGNTLGWDCGSGAPAPIVGSVPGGGNCGSSIGDSGPDVFWRSNDDGTDATASTAITPTEARSQAVLTVPAGATVTHAWLYWAGDREGFGTGADDTVTLDRPDGAGGTVFSSQVTAAMADQFTNDDYFQSVADVTATVQANGSGVYRVSGLDVHDFRNDNKDVTFAGWTLVVFYSDPSEPTRNLSIFDGLDLVDNNAVTATLSGFLVPNAGFDAKLAAITYEGDGQFSGDRLLFGQAPLNNADSVADALNPANNFFNSSRSTLGVSAFVAGDLPELTGGALSMGSFDLDVVDITDRLSAGQTEADIAATTSGDVYLLGAFITSISTLEPDFTSSTKDVEDINGGTVEVGDQLRYTIDVINNGTDTAVDVVLTDPIPNGVTYLPGSLEITSGPGTGALTDAAGDDQGEYDGGTETLTVRLGNGADATNGGTLAIGESTTLEFIVTIDANAMGVIENQAIINAGGELGAPPADTPTDGNGGDPGAPPTEIEIDDCPPGDTCIDTDGDGIYDDDETAIGTDPNDADSDDDGVPDGDEPDFDEDTDGDGLINALDPDSDNDGLFDGTELGITMPNADTDVNAGHFIPDADAGATTTDPLDADTDDGGVIDGAEDYNLDGAIDQGELDPNDPSDDVNALDTDGDGLTDGTEMEIGTDPNDADSDDDGVLDGDEPNFSDDTDGDGDINALDQDSDGDGILDGTELGTDCSDPDTGDDCVPDADGGEETTSPVNPDTDGGGVPDGEEDANHNGQIDEGERDPNDPSDDMPQMTGSGGAGGGSSSSSSGSGSSSSGVGGADLESLLAQGGCVCGLDRGNGTSPGHLAWLLAALGFAWRRQRRRKRR
jgi:uncharacterized repeat protein (TIGR01451 family)/MYXO-CTERM domain-containing protein